MTMHTFRRVHFIRAMTVASVIAACVWMSYRDAAHSGIQGSGIRRVLSIGRITSFGSIYVNGVEYSTAHAQVSINDQPGTEAQLRVGQIVMLEGSVQGDARIREATDVAFFSDARGPVTKLNATRNTFEVLGQTVRINRETLYGADEYQRLIESPEERSYVEVSGFSNADGELVATSVERVPADGALQVRGTVAGLDQRTRTFRINALIVDYGAIAPEGRLGNGAVVTVHGANSSRANVLQASRVSVVPSSAGPVGAHVDVQGIVTSISSLPEFTLGAMRVTTNASTRFSLHGQQLSINLPVRVKGVFDGSGSVVADKVTAQPSSSFTVSGYVSSIMGYALTVNGKSINLSETTAYKDKSVLKLKTFGLDDLAVGDYVEIRGGFERGGDALCGAVVLRKQPKEAKVHEDRTK